MKTANTKVVKMWVVVKFGKYREDKVVHISQNECGALDYGSMFIVDGYYVVPCTLSFIIPKKTK